MKTAEEILFIRNQATTALELTKGFTPEQRARFSNSLKTIEEFAGYILELTNTSAAQEMDAYKKRLKDEFELKAKSEYEGEEREWFLRGVKELIDTVK